MKRNKYKNVEFAQDIVVGDWLEVPGPAHLRMVKVRSVDHILTLVRVTGVDFAYKFPVRGLVTIWR